MEITIVERQIPVEVYQNLRVASELSAKTREASELSLIADGDASFLYQKFGFKDTLPESKGMYLQQ